MEAYPKAIENVDLLIAPHHGRKSGRSYDFLDVMKPKLTFFGNAPSEHLAYSAWLNRGLDVMTNNQAGCLVVDLGLDGGPVFATHEPFARARAGDQATFYEEYGGYLCGLLGHPLRPRKTG